MAAAVNQEPIACKIHTTRECGIIECGTLNSYDVMLLKFYDSFFQK